jgi:hypothetical protein
MYKLPYSVPDQGISFQLKDKGKGTVLPGQCKGRSQGAVITNYGMMIIKGNPMNI